MCVILEFAMFVNRRGDPSTDKPLMEWEGKAERVAWHAPYFVVFSSRFIEVHSAETGRLVQVIRGQNIRATWDGDGASLSQPTWPGEDQQWLDVFDCTSSRIHAVERVTLPAPPSAQLSSGSTPAQHVFELVPAVRLAPDSHSSA